MKMRIAIWMLALAMSAARALAYTGCAGDATNGSSVATEYLFGEGTGTNTINTGTDGAAGDATAVKGATLTTNAPPLQVACRGVASLPASGTGSLTPAVETSGSYDPLAGATNFTLMAWVKRESSSAASNTSARILSDTSSTSLATNTAGFEFRFSGSAGTLAVRVNGNELVSPPSAGSLPTATPGITSPWSTTGCDRRRTRSRGTLISTWTASSVDWVYPTRP